MNNEEHLRHQIRQLREAIVSIENKNNGRTGMRPSELWTMIASGNDPLHPRLERMLQGHVSVQSLKTGLARLENDLDDLQQNSLSHSPKYTFEETDESDETEGFGQYERTD